MTPTFPQSDLSDSIASMTGGYLHSVYKNMKTRVCNKNSSSYHNYGGRGVRIDPAWMTFEGFAKWAKANGYKTGFKMFRHDVQKDYCPENCYWAPDGPKSKT